MQHLACIMDGNRRFAKKHGWEPWLGHEKGVEAVRTTIDFCVKTGIRFLSLYTFSLENFKRSIFEKEYLFNLLVKQISNHGPELTEKRIQVRFIGDRKQFPISVLDACNEIELATKQGDVLQVNFLFCYGGQQEIVSATHQIICAVRQGKISPECINESLFAEHMWLGDIPAPDLIFRTGGVRRLSNFLLFQAAYAELYFTDLFWPEITAEHLKDAIDSFNHQTRNFGL